MPDSTNFQEHIEQIHKDLEQRVGQTAGVAPVKEKQIIREIIKERFAPKPSAQAAQPQPPAAAQGAGQTQAQAAPSHEELERQYQQAVDSFIEKALTNDLQKVVQEVNDSDNPWVIDQFHDTLVDKFYSEITARRGNKAKE